MVYIQKRRTPDIVKQKAVEIIKTPDSGYSSINLPQDTFIFQKLELCL